MCTWVMFTLLPQCWACEDRGWGEKVTECWLRASCKFHCVYNTLIAIKTGVLWKLHLLLSNLSLRREITFCHLTTHLTFWKVSELSIINSILRSLCTIQFKAEDRTKKTPFCFKDKIEDNWKNTSWYRYLWYLLGKILLGFWWSSHLPYSEGHINQIWHTADGLIKSKSWAWFVSSGQVKRNLMVSPFSNFPIEASPNKSIFYIELR